MLTADDRTPVAVLATLISTRDRRSLRWTWRGRVTPIDGASLLDCFFRADSVQLYVAGQPNPCIITSLGLGNSEVEGLAPPTF